MMYVLITSVHENKFLFLAHSNKPHLKQESQVLSNSDLEETKILELERIEDTSN